MAVEFKVERHDGLALRSEFLFQDGMSGLDPVETGCVVHEGIDAADVLAEQSLGADEVECSEEFPGFQQLRQ